MARTVSEFSTCSPSGDTVKDPCISLTVTYSHCLGQRKRERLHSLERRLDARLVTTNAMSASGGEIQPQHLMQPPLLRPGNPGTPNEPLYDLHPDSMIGACNASFTYLAPPYESACNTSSEISSLYVRDQFRINTPLPYGMAPGNFKVAPPAVVMLTGLVYRHRTPRSGNFPVHIPIGACN
ncbi:hypothetical protein SS1G_10138 [Sclerotinia sclerotiorum 1980 UF-70]|uniref:Uncharacterized protein n=1 Tax=Sclerotinia sclerotiorum (strain ATCC 18683 / 1980 / Ss-1) TaxID=665079 RepID=A7EXS3_SCLS1|nr:hypothetical protein SS1G_10138 [Sclerotinia sclerotiorum 1980 UF-70]EDN94265.1 hypothetical protein SS1G_10138 [Sclerotinia sclerotiorum 1980 UF-70]